MPPKKAVKETKELVQAPNRDEEAARLFAEARIKILEESVENANRKINTLTEQNEMYKRIQNQISTDKQDIVEFLSGQVSTLNSECDQIKANIEAMEKKKNSEIEGLKITHLESLKTEGARYEAKEKELKETQDELKMIMDQSANQRDLLKQVADLETELELKKKQHEESEHELDKKALLDRMRLAGEMESKVADVANDFRKVYDNRMAETTKRAVRENNELSAQLIRLSQSSLELMAQNKLTMKQNRELKRDIELLKAAEKEWALKSRLAKDGIGAGLIDGKPALW